jgi:hypothetical protein
MNYFSQDGIDSAVIDCAVIIKEENGGVYTTLDHTEVMQVLTYDADVSTINIDDVRETLDDVEDESGHESADYEAALEELRGRVSNSLETVG